MQETFEPNPFKERIEEIKKKSLSLNVKAGDLVQLNKESVEAIYRKAKKGEPYTYMISTYISLSSPTQEFIVLSCSGLRRFRECVERLIVENFELDYRCGVSPCECGKGKL